MPAAARRFLRNRNSATFETRLVVQQQDRRLAPISHIQLPDGVVFFGVALLA